MTDPHHERAIGNKHDHARDDFDVDEEFGESFDAKADRSEEPVIPIRNVAEAGAVDQDRIQSEIRERAYELYQSRGASDGDDMTDWLQAEEDVRRRHSI